MLKVNINGLLRGDFDNNMYLEPGDIINIPAGGCILRRGRGERARIVPAQRGHDSAPGHLHGAGDEIRGRVGSRHNIPR